MGGNLVYGKDIYGRVCPVAEIQFNLYNRSEGCALRTSGHRIEFIKAFDFDPTSNFDHYTTEKETVQ